MIPPFFSPAEAMRLSIRGAMMLTEAQMVILLRLFGMMGMWQVRPGEASRMVGEKIAATVESGAAAQRAMLAGRSSARVAEAALAPVARRTRANAKRLAARGPGQPS
jgi:hypothetical protein